ncbi:hypothetical protein TNCV_4743401 [Trichonephila clavipes]|nr:hypothetical protein TNCV_4743401 [Trichonephila clavipes]
MDEDRTTKKVFNAPPFGTQRKDRPNLRWIDGLEKYLLFLRTKNWRTQAGRRLASSEGHGTILDCRTTEDYIPIY